MKTRMLMTQAVLAAAALLFAGAAAASLSVVDCSDLVAEGLGAEANGESPLYCASGDAGDDPTSETTAINAVFSGVLGTVGDPFMFVGKYDSESGIDEAVPGYTFTAEEAESPWDYAFKLISAYQGQSVDFVLMVKQPEGAGGPIRNVAYAWTGLVLDIDGFFNSFNGDYSHVSGFIRGTFDYDVSEPGALLLLGAGLLGFAVMRRRVGC